MPTETGAQGRPEPVSCKGCNRRLLPWPDINAIRLYWVCKDMACSEYGRHQRVVFAAEYYGTPAPHGEPPRPEPKWQQCDRCGYLHPPAVPLCAPAPSEGRSEPEEDEDDESLWCGCGDSKPADQAECWICESIERDATPPASPAPTGEEPRGQSGVIEVRTADLPRVKPSPSWPHGTPVSAPPAVPTGREDLRERVARTFYSAFHEEGDLYYREEWGAYADCIHAIYAERLSSLERELDEAVQRQEKITQGAIALIGGPCDEHRGEIRGMSFDAFVEAGGAECVWCRQARAEAAERRAERLKAALREIQSEIGDNPDTTTEGYVLDIVARALTHTERPHAPESERGENGP